LVVRVVGLFFALEMAISGSYGLWPGLALQTLIFDTIKLDRGVQLSKSYKMSLSWFKSKGYRFLHIRNTVLYGIYLYTCSIYSIWKGDIRSWPTLVAYFIRVGLTDPRANNAMHDLQFFILLPCIPWWAWRV
jgi:hypothetical protein